MLGNNNDVNNGDVWAGTGSNVAVGHSNVHDSGTTATGSATVIKDNSAPVLNDVDASGGNGGGASAGSGGGLIGIGGSNAHGGNAGGGGIVINDPTTNNVQRQPDARRRRHRQRQHAWTPRPTPRSTNTQRLTDTTTSVADNSDSSVHQTSTRYRQLVAAQRLGVRQQPRHARCTNSALDNSHDSSLASGNHLLGF